MLILTRRMNEKIMIGEAGQIVVTVVEIDARTGVIRLGIDAAREIPIHRHGPDGQRQLTREERNTLRIKEEAERASRKR